MFKHIIFTFGNKLGSAIIGLLIVTLVSNILGAEGLGTISLILLGITIVLSVNSFISGGGMIYMVPRHHPIQLIIPAYIWALASTGIVTYILHYFKLIPVEYSEHIFFLSLIHTAGQVNNRLLLGKERIGAFNMITFLQIIVQGIVLVFFLWILRRKDISSYICSLYAAYGFTLLSSFVLTKKYMRIHELAGVGRIIRKMFMYSGFAQLANLLQLFVYRLTYYYIDYYYDKSILGILALSVRLAEGIWLISKSISLVLYTKIANLSNESEAPLLTIRVLKVSLIIGVCCVLVLFLIPVQLYQAIFGQEFGYVRLVIIYLSPGIISVVGHSIIAHYFSGTGRHYLNTIGSAIGLAVVAGVGILIVPSMALKGAAIASSLAYIFSFVFHITVFMKITGTSLYALIPSKEDARFIIHKFYRSFKNQHLDKRYDNVE